MNVNNYIKVEKDGRTHIILVGNKSFYQSQGYNITTPTEEEILAAFPELAVKNPNATKRNTPDPDEKSKQTFDRIKKANDELQAKIDEKDKEIEKLKSSETSEELAEARKVADKLQEEKDDLSKENETIKNEKKELESIVSEKDKEIEKLKAAAKNAATKTTK